MVHSNAQGYRNLVFGHFVIDHLWIIEILNELLNGWKEQVVYDANLVRYTAVLLLWRLRDLVIEDRANEIELGVPKEKQDNQRENFPVIFVLSPWHTYKFWSFPFIFSRIELVSNKPDLKGNKTI